MTPPMATRVPSTWLRADQYACSRCGRIGTVNASKPKPVYCRDCRAVEHAPIKPTEKRTT